MYDFGMIKVPSNFYAAPIAGPTPTPADDGTPDSERNRKPRTRLSKWLAKIAGVYDGEMEPKTEAEYYLNEIAAKGGGSSGGGVFYIPILREMNEGNISYYTTASIEDIRNALLAERQIVFDTGDTDGKIVANRYFIQENGEFIVGGDFVNDSPFGIRITVIGVSCAEVPGGGFDLSVGRTVLHATKQ